MSVNVSSFVYFTIGLQACNKTGTQYSITFPLAYLIDVFAWWGRNSDTRFEQVGPPTLTEYRCDKPPCGFFINIKEKIVLSVSYSGFSPRSWVNRRKYLDVANRYLTTEVRHDSTACITSAQFLCPHLLDLMFLYFPAICLLLHAFPRMSVRLYINNI